MAKFVWREVGTEAEAIERGRDHVQIEFIGTRGRGFRGIKTGCLVLERCPRCERENYFRNVLDGSCAWCGFVMAVDSVKEQ